MTDKKGIILYTPEGKLVVPEFPIIPFIEGDGTGPDIWRATRLVLDESVSRTYGNTRRIRWVEVLAGEKAFHRTGSWLPEETLKLIRTYRVAFSDLQQSWRIDCEPLKAVKYMSHLKVAAI
jgi:isocitrate dehydrogenase